MLDKILSFLGQPVERFDVTSQLSKLSSSLCYGIYDPVRRTVRLYMYARSSQNIALSDVLFTIPTEYRPKFNTGIPAINTMDNQYTGAYHVTIQSDGKIKQNLSNSCREVMAVGEYII